MLVLKEIYELKATHFKSLRNQLQGEISEQSILADMLLHLGEFGYLFILWSK